MPGSREEKGEQAGEVEATTGAGAQEKHQGGSSVCVGWQLGLHGVHPAGWAAQPGPRILA